MDRTHPDDGLVTLGTLSGLGMTAAQGSDWAMGYVGAFATVDPPHSLILAEAASWVRRAIQAVVPAPLRLIGDQVRGPADTNPRTLSAEVSDWPARAALGEVIAATGLWQPPPLRAFPQVRIEGCAGWPVAERAPRDQVQYWAVHGVDASGLPEWVADFTELRMARRFTARWDRPGQIVCADHIQTLQRHPALPPWSTPTPTGRTSAAGRTAARGHQGPRQH